MNKLLQKLKRIEDRYIEVYERLMMLLKKAAKLASLFEHNEFELSPKVIDHVRSIKVENKKKDEEFEIWKYLNYKDSIAGLKIPLTYQEVLKNPNVIRDIDNNK